MRILQRWWRAKQRSGRSSTSKLWWVWDDVMDDAVAGRTCLAYMEDGGAAAACAALPCRRTGTVLLCVISPLGHKTWNASGGLVKQMQESCLLALRSFTLIHRCCISLRLPAPTWLTLISFHQTISDTLFSLQECMYCSPQSPYVSPNEKLIRC